MRVDREEISVRIPPGPVSAPSRTSSYLSPFAPHARTGIPVVGHAEASVLAPAKQQPCGSRVRAPCSGSGSCIAAPCCRSSPAAGDDSRAGRRGGALTAQSRGSCAAAAVVVNQWRQRSAAAGAGSDAGSGGVDLGGVGRVLTWRLRLSAIRARLLGRPAFSRWCRHVVGSVARVGGPHVGSAIASRCRVALLRKPSVRAGIPCEEREQLHHRALVEEGHAAV